MNFKETVGRIKKNEVEFADLNLFLAPTFLLWTVGVTPLFVWTIVHQYSVFYRSTPVDVSFSQGGVPCSTM